ncbi:MAG: hypothetical protein KHX03_00955 [Clostridium sp.]|nr:hypothetical protein [Clostridium sp.]
MKIILNNSYSPKYNNHNHSQKHNVNFQGRMDVLKYALNKNKGRNEGFFFINVSSFLDVSERSLKKYTERFKRYKMDFLYSLAQKYNIDKRNMTPELQNESKNVLFSIYDKVKYPNNIYKTLINDTNYNFKQLDNIIDLSIKEPQKQNLIQNLLNVYKEKNGKHTVPYKVMVDFLSTPSSKQISANFETYRPFIKLNTENSEVVSKLEEEIQKGYDKSVFEKRLNIRELTQNNSILSNMDKNILEKNYNESRINVLNAVDMIYAPLSNIKQESIRKKTDILWEIYNTTNDKNASLRQKVANFAIRKINFENREQDAQLESLVKIYRHIDENPMAKTFVTQALKDNYRLRSFTNIEKTLSKGNLELINKYPAEVKEYLWNHNNIADITIEDIEEINSKINNHSKKYSINLKEKIKAMFSFKKDQNLYLDATQALKIPQSTQKQKLNIIENAVVPLKGKETYSSKTYPSTPIFCGKKKNIIIKINEIIDSKLARLNSEEQLWQKRDYAIKATKIRLNLLQDMFKSVKDTRIADRINGRKPSVSNKDVLRLYEAVNGKNAKDVKRMLKETDSKGNRKFNILEIAEIFEKKNKEENLKKLHRNSQK